MKKYILLLTITLSILLGSCNSEGSGIFFQISQEVEQISSELSELAVHQVVEVGTDLYARTGRKVWVQNGTTWTDVSQGNYIYNIVEFSGLLYGVINNDDIDLNDGQIKSYNAPNWDPEGSYNTDLFLIEANGTYVLLKGINGVDSIATSTDPTALPDNEAIIDQIIDGASHTGNVVNILISKDNLYGTAIGSLSSIVTTFNIAVSGNYTGITVDLTDNFYLSTSSGQIYISSDNGVNWTLVNSITDDIPSENSLAVVTVDGGTSYYLIIGTNNGYYEMEIGTAVINTPTVTTSVFDFDASYPDLATSLIYEVYQSANGVAGNYFYLSTSNGLWKRNADGTFSKQ